MKRNNIIRAVAALLLLAMMTALLPTLASAEGGTLYITGYTLTDSKGKSIGQVRKGDTVTVTVSVKDTGDGSGAGDPKDLDITKLEDSFTGGSVSVEKTSSENQPLVYAISFTGVKYKGTGQSLKFQIGTAGNSDSYQNMELTVTEAVVYEPSPGKPDEPSTPEPNPAPMVLVSRNEIKTPIEAGQEREVTISFQNLSQMKLKSPVVTFTPSDGLMLSGGSDSFLLEDIAGKKTGSITIKVQAVGNITSPNQSLGVELKFNYNNSVSTVQGSITDKISIPALAQESVSQPVVIVTRAPLEKPISAGETADVTIQFQNAGKTTLVSPVVGVTASEALILQNDASTFLLKDIAPGKSESITVKVQATKEIASANQSLSTELKYAYDNAGVLTQATASDRVNLTANPTSAAPEKTKTDAPVPNIVIREFQYGGTSVAAGSKFPLQFTFENTGTLKVENIVVTVDGGESFTMDGSTNTFFYKTLAAGGNQLQEVPMQVVPNGKSGAQSIGVGFKYEYLDGDKRAQASADIKISIPVYQPDRFQINAPLPPESAVVGEEAEVSMAYVNKGKDDIYNVEATVEGEGVDTPAHTQYLGNIAAGASGTIGFALTPQAAGETSLVLKISYENSDQQLQTREFPITIQAEEPAPMDDFPMDGMEETPRRRIPWLWIGLGGAGAAGGIVLVILRKKRKHGDPVPAAGGWDDWNEEESTQKGE